MSEVSVSSSGQSSGSAVETAGFQILELGGGIQLFDFADTMRVGKILQGKFSAEGKHKAVDEIVAEFFSDNFNLGDWRKGEIQLTGINRIIRNRFWCEVEHAALFPPKTGDTPVSGSYRSIRWNTGRMSGVAAICVTESGDFVLLENFRHAKREWCLEAARGGILAGETIEQCALREAREECGVVPTEDSEIIDLGVLDADTGLLAADSHIVLVTKCRVKTDAADRDETESYMKGRPMSPSQVKELIATNKIRDSFFLAGLVMAWSQGHITL